MPTRFLLFLVCAIAACGDRSPRTLDLCARGDRALLAASLAGGRLDVSIAVEGEVVAEASIPVDDEASRVDVDLPAGRAEVTVEGYDAGGELVASGAGLLEQAGGCACIAFAAQAAAVCGGVDCQVVADQCRFSTAGLPTGRQTLAVEPVADTWLEEGQPEQPHGGDVTLEVAAGAVALIRFDLTALPAGATVEGATLTLARADESTSRPTLDLVAAAWDPATATWSQAPAVDAAGLVASPGPTDTILYDLTDLVARWVSAAADHPNHGVALSLAAGSAMFDSADATGGAPILRIEYSVEAMGVLPAGVFERGCQDTCDPEEETGIADGCGCDEQPAHTVSLAEFEIDRVEVTEAAYAACVAAGACSAPASSEQCLWDPSARPNYPVTCVTWDQARAYCDFAGKRLPSEAEWERAAAGSLGGPYPWGSGMPTCELASSYYCHPGAPEEAAAEGVGRHPAGASREGPAEVSVDMAGNVFEWVADVYDPAHYGDLASAGEPAENPTGPEEGDERVRRGGFFFSGEWFLRAGNRDHLPAASTHVGTGFRCAR